MTRPGFSAEERFWIKVQKGPGCWTWGGARSSDGYGTFRERKNDKTHRAHRLAYELTVGPIPEGMLLDHRCHNKVCVNPAHLRPVTRKQNGEHRGSAPRNSTTGVLGVTQSKVTGLYMARVGHNGRLHHAGRFQTLEEAAEAARQLRLSLFTHNDADRRTA